MTRVLAGLPYALIAALLVMVTACQTIPTSGFTAAQREMLMRRGFEERDGNYLLGLNNRLLFGFDSSEIDQGQRAMLRDLGRELAAVGIISARVEGHASSEGNGDHNLKLSERRAQAVSVMLVEGGLSNERMRVVALGASDPLVSNDQPEGRRQNRRVVIIVTPTDVLAI